MDGSSMKTDYRHRVKLPPTCSPADQHLEFRTKTGVVIARGYVRVEFGGRGPYIEFAPGQIVNEAIRYVDNPSHRYYHEYRSIDGSNVKLYLQRRPVNYARYVPEMWYVSPFDLITDKYELVTPRNVEQSLLPGLAEWLTDGRGRGST